MSDYRDWSAHDAQSAVIAENMRAIVERECERCKGCGHMFVDGDVVTGYDFSGEGGYHVRCAK
jgi:hypothetical protein